MQTSTTTINSQSTASSTLYQVKIDCLPKRAKIEELQKLFAYISDTLKISFTQSHSQNTKSALIATDTEKEYYDLLKSSKMIHGRHITCEPLHSSDFRPKKIFTEENSKRVFIKKIPSKLPDSELKTIFSQFGEVEYAYSIKKNKVGTGYGFAKFIEKSSAQKALNSKVVKCQNFVLDCCPFKKEDRNAKTRSRGNPTSSAQISSPNWFQPGAVNANRILRSSQEDSPIKAGLVTYGVLLWHRNDNLCFNQQNMR